MGYIEIRGLHKAFSVRGQPLPVLQGVDLDIEEGEIFGIIGYSGAGKSTLARCINRLEEADKGEILVGGINIRALNKSELLRERRNIGMIFQQFNLFEAQTVYENIAYPLKISGVSRSEIRGRMMEAAKVVGLSDKLYAYPGGLSGGQKQRVGIARAIVGRPSVLLSDEATSALDPKTTLSILELLKEINAKTGITILMITHELDVIKYSCSRMAVLENGVIIESGDTSEVFGNPKSKTGELFFKVYDEFRSDKEYTGGDGI
ncbi:MAG: ATP-binding cassette domain-containing protein [Synergistaceae bacterium]|jgi:D-methionine transport system ATP-binding protein|nr:ATP-binding cassette domain-containing protein [Synergistaceae bacterium]